METEVYFRTVNFCSSGRVASIFSSMKAVLTSTSMAKSSTTVNSTLVSRSRILIYDVMLPSILNRSSDVYQSDGWTSSDILDDQSVCKKTFKIWFGWASSLRTQAKRCVILFSAPITIHTKFADCHVTAIFELWFAYLSSGNFTSLFFNNSYPALLSDLNFAKCFKHLYYESSAWTICSRIHTCGACLL